MNDKIIQALNKLFERSRVVFWNDAKSELRHEFEAVEIPGVEKAEIKNNEFGLKYRILRESPGGRFLLYREGPPPACDKDNWLLDLELAGCEFRADQASLWLDEIGLGIDFSGLVESHAFFFNSAKRRGALKLSAAATGTPSAVRLKMIAVCAGCDTGIEEITLTLLNESSLAQDEKFNLIKKSGLDGFLFETLGRAFAYSSGAPGVKDFGIELFKSCYAMACGQKYCLNADALVLFKRWKDDRRYAAAFEKFSEECAEIMNISQDLAGKDFRTLIDIDHFKMIDEKIIGELIGLTVKRSAVAADIDNFCRARRCSRWYDNYKHLYEAVAFAARFTGILDSAGISVGSMADAVTRYCAHWFRLDQCYRKFIYNARKSGEVTLLEPLQDMIENLYTNNYLLKLNDHWQAQLDAADTWNVPSVTRQRDFFEKFAKPFLDRDNKIFVIISDALRYEIGEELANLINREDRFDASIEPMIAMTPSFTQLGMGALLPNKTLEISADGGGAVLVDSQNSQGTQNRSKILAGAVAGGAASAVRAEDVMSMNKADCQTLIRDNRIVYIYHNVIDSTGDKRETEERTFEAAEEALLELVRLVKKLTGANANNLIITADHGFIYQNRQIPESDFTEYNAGPEIVYYRDRRFIAGKNLPERSGLKKFSAAALGLEGDGEVLLSKSIGRLRLRGSGSRFVHGGAALQEIVVPVVRINKKRQSDISQVEVQIIGGADSIITSGQLAVVFYQKQPVTDKVKARKLRAGIYNKAGEPISNCRDIDFDSADENSRAREFTVNFILTRKADESNNDQVFLRLDEKHSATSHYKEYCSRAYTVRRAFTSDFDL
jgi:uncharacterized protein (TIGR02687 family)